MVIKDESHCYFFQYRVGNKPFGSVMIADNDYIFITLHEYLDDIKITGQERAEYCDVIKNNGLDYIMDDDRGIYNGYGI